MEEKKGHAVPATIGVLLLLLALYVGSYFALVKTSVSPLVSVNGVPTPYVPRYRFGGPPVYIIYAPIHWVDRRMRPDYWREP
jgi:hypothetical protein